MTKVSWKKARESSESMNLLREICMRIEKDFRIVMSSCQIPGQTSFSPSLFGRPLQPYPRLGFGV